MKKALDWLRKFNTPLCYAIICLVFGVAFIALPFFAPLALDILLIIAGVCSIAVGIVTIVDLETTDRSMSYYLNVVKTLVFIGAGIFIIIARSGLATSICLWFGIYILVRAIPMLVKLVTSPLSKDREWWVRLVLSIVEILLGCWLIFYPVWPHILAGAMLVIISIELFIKHRKGGWKKPTGDSTLFDLHFEDKS